MICERSESTVWGPSKPASGWGVTLRTLYRFKSNEGRCCLQDGPGHPAAGCRRRLSSSSAFASQLPGGQPRAPLPRAPLTTLRSRRRTEPDTEGSSDGVPSTGHPPGAGRVAIPSGGIERADYDCLFCLPDRGRLDSGPTRGRDRPVRYACPYHRAGRARAVLWCPPRHKPIADAGQLVPRRRGPARRDAGHALRWAEREGIAGGRLPARPQRGRRPLNSVGHLHLHTSLGGPPDWWPPGYTAVTTRPRLSGSLPRGPIRAVPGVPELCVLLQQLIPVPNPILMAPARLPTQR